MMVEETKVHQVIHETEIHQVIHETQIFQVYMQENISWWDTIHSKGKHMSTFGIKTRQNQIRLQSTQDCKKIAANCSLYLIMPKIFNFQFPS